jgi:hypothetical protein
MLIEVIGRGFSPYFRFRAADHPAGTIEIDDDVRDRWDFL